MEDKKTRREFLGDVVKKGSLAAMGGLACIGLSHEFVLAGKTPGKILYTPEIDPEMILYKEIAKPLFTGFSDSHSVIADNDGVLYVTGDQAILVIDPAGSIRETVNLTVSPFCLALTDTGFLIGTRDSVVIADKKGKIMTSWPVPGDNPWVTGIVLADDQIFIADAGQRIIWCVDLKGNFIQRIGDKNPDKDVPGFSVPSPYFKLAMGQDGLLRVANPGRHRIEAYTVNGNPAFAWGRFGNRHDDFTGCCNPASFTVLSDGSVITCEKGAARVKVYDTFGKLKGYVTEPGKLVYTLSSSDLKRGNVHPFVFDVAADNKGRVFLLDRSANVMRFFRSKEQTGG